ncbi:Transposase [compost metagenome]
MTRLRRSFTAEFKLEAASLVLDQGYSVSEASRSLDVGETVLRRWVQQLQSERTGTTPISKALTPEQQKIQELEARINRLEREKAILKKATALLNVCADRPIKGANPHHAGLLRFRYSNFLFLRLSGSYPHH